MIAPFANAAVAEAYDAMPARSREIALVLRDLIYETAWDMPQVGPVAESLKWGQPSYAVARGTPLRIAVPKAGGCGLYVHCQTTLIADYAALVAGADRIEGNRGVLFGSPDDIVETRLRLIVRSALTYHTHETARRD